MRVVVVGTAIVLVAAAAGVALAPQLHPGYRWRADDLTVETALSVIGLLAYFLVFGWLRRRTRLNDLMLACAIAVLALSSLFLVTVPAVAGWAPDELTVWGAPAAGSFGALLFVLSAWLPNRQSRPSGPLLVAGAGAVITVLLLTMALIPALCSHIAASGGGFADARLVHPARHAPGSGATRPATRYGGAVRRGRRRVRAAFPARPR